MESKRSLFATLIGVFLGIATLVILVSCVGMENPVERTVREHLLCKKLGRSAAKPIDDGPLVAMMAQVAKGRAPEGGVVLCLMPEQRLPSIESMTLKDQRGTPTVVVWIEARLLREIDRRALRFFFAHEIGHYAIVGYCPEDDLPAYLSCEHRIDRYGAGVVGKNDALYGLERLEAMVTARGATPADAAIVRERWRLLKKDL